MRWFSITAFTGILLATSLAVAGDYNQTLSTGDQAPAWSDLPATDGKTHSLNDFKNKDVVVLVFTCASCPVANDYEIRINELARKYSANDAKVGVIAVCVNAVAADRLDKLTERASEKKFIFPVMYDESQKIATDYGASHTPEFFVINKDRKVVYMGAMDDADDPEKVKRRFVDDAIAAALAGNAPLVKETLARGCLVRWARKRK